RIRFLLCQVGFRAALPSSKRSGRSSHRNFHLNRIVPMTTDSPLNIEGEWNLAWENVKKRQAALAQSIKDGRGANDLLRQQQKTALQDTLKAYGKVCERL